MRRVGIREFRDRATYYLKGKEMIAIERHGKLVGFFMPVKERDEQEIHRSLEDLEKTVKEVLDRSGMTEDELAGLFELNKPMGP